jgi:hypothetical protein
MPTPASVTLLQDVCALAASAMDMFKSSKTLALLMASIRLPDPPTLLERRHMRTHLVPDQLHSPLQAVFDHNSLHGTFMDDNMMTAERDTILAIINTIVLSAYFLYCFPGDDIMGGRWPRTNTNLYPTTTKNTWA